MAGKLLPNRNRVQSVCTNFFNDLTEFHNQSLEAATRNRDIVKWIEHHRWIDGKPWSFQSSGPLIEWGANDVVLDKLPRPYLFQFLNDLTRERSAIKCRQCVVGETTVYTEQDGELALRSIEVLYNEKYKGNIFYHADGKNSICRVKDVWYSGKKDVYEVKLGNGFKIQCSIDHKLFHDSLKELVPLKNLKIGDPINVYRDDFGDHVLPDGFPELFGYFLTDGTYNISSKGIWGCSFRNQNINYINEFSSYLDERHRIYKFQNDTRECYDVVIKKGSKFRAMLDEFNLVGKVFEQRQIPDKLMKLNKEQTSLMINRMFSGNGYCHRRKRGKKSVSYEIGIGSLSYVFLTQLQLLLRRFDIKSTIKVSTQKSSKREFWKLNISTHRKHVLRFIEEIGIYDKITEEDFNVIERFSRYNNRIAFNKKDNDTNKIISIKKIGKRKTYDLAVSDIENHVFYANGFLISNSEYSENHINEGLYWALTRPSTRISHIFPTDELGNAISNEKIRTAIEGSPLINAQTIGKAVHNYTFKNQSFYNVTGALKRAGLRAGSRDMLMFDEVDSMSDGIFGVAEEMLSHSSLKFVRKFSTGTVPGVGIDKIVSSGCGYEWWVVCSNPKCKKHQTFTFPENIINYFDVSQYDPQHPDYMKKLNQVYIGCKHCGAYIDRGSKHYVATSYWKAKWPEMIGRHASYYIVMAMIPWKTGKEILRRYHELADYEWQFYNEVWGVAFLKGDYTLSELELRACEQPWQMIYSRIPILQNVSVGIDWGEKSSWVVVMANGIDLQYPSTKCVVYVEEVNKYSLEKSGLSDISLNHVERVKQIVEAFGAEIIVNDANGLGVDRNSDLIQSYDKRAWGCFFDTAEQSRQLRKSTLQEPAWSPAQHKVTISKINVWKTIQSEIRRRQVMFPSSQGHGSYIMNAFIHHMQALGIQSRFDVEKNREFEVAVKLHSNDHLADAFMYANIGFQKLTGYQSGTIPGVIMPTKSTAKPRRTIGVS